MNHKFKLTAEDIDIKQENALEMFYSGIKSKSTKETADRLLRFFLIDVCVDLLQGDYKNVELIVIIRVTLQKAIKFYHF